MDLPAKEGNVFPLPEVLKERRVKRRAKKGPKGKRKHKPKVLSFWGGDKYIFFFFGNEQKQLLTDLHMIKIAQLSRPLNIVCNL